MELIIFGYHTIGIKMTQQNKLLEKLKAEGIVNSYFATYNMGIKQAPTRIYELKEMGYDISSHAGDNGSVNWILDYKEPKAPEWVFVGGRAILKSEPKQLSL